MVASRGARAAAGAVLDEMERFATGRTHQPRHAKARGVGSRVELVRRAAELGI